MMGLLSGDIKDITKVLCVDFKTENESIIFTAKLSFSYDPYNTTEYKIGRYDLSTGYGHIITSKGLKEYSNLKSLCKATWNFNPSLGFDIERVMSYKKNFKPEAKEEVIEPVKVIKTIEDIKEEPAQVNTDIEKLNNEIADVKEQIKNIENTGNQIYLAIQTHEDRNKTPDKQSYEYKKLHESLDYIDSIEDGLNEKLKVLRGRLATLSNTNLIKEYGDSKYKVILSDKTIFVDDYNQFIDCEKVQVRQLIYINNSIWATEVNVYDRFIDECNNDVICTREYNKEGVLRYHSKYFNKVLFYDAIIRKDLTCTYYGSTGIRQLSFFSPSIPLQFIEKRADDTINMYWWYGNNIREGTTEAAKEKIVRFKEKYINDTLVMDYLKFA